jgi:hypothetical protein
VSGTGRQARGRCQTRAVSDADGVRHAAAGGGVRHADGIRHADGVKHRQGQARTVSDMWRYLTRGRCQARAVSGTDGVRHGRCQRRGRCQTSAVLDARRCAGLGGSVRPRLRGLERRGAQKRAAVCHPRFGNSAPLLYLTAVLASLLTSASCWRAGCLTRGQFLESFFTQRLDFSLMFMIYS